MRYCNFPFRRIYVNWMGSVHLCSWLNGAPIGYITDGLEKIWRSEEANAVRQSVIDGSFRRCRKDVCPYIMNNTLPEVEADTVENLTSPLPTHFSLAYDYTCNLACPSCRRDFIHGTPRSQDFFNNVYAELKPYLNKLAFLNIGGHGDPLFSKHSLHILKNLRPELADATVSIETNGTLFTPSLWKKIEHLGDFNLHVTVSVETLNPYVYARLRRGGNFNALHKNIRFLSELRKQGRIKKLLAVMVVQDVNFMEMPMFAEYCTDLGFDIVNFETLYNWGTFTEKEYFPKNLLNPLHPHHEFFNDLRTELIKDKRVLFWAGNTNRNSARYAVAGSSQCLVSEISPEDTVEFNTDIAALSDAIYNRDYVFILKEGVFYGMLTYKEYHDYFSSNQCVPCIAGDLCKSEHTVIYDKNINKIFSEKENYINSCQNVFPIVHDGILHAKLLTAQ